MTLHMTGKQLWDALAELDAEKVRLLDKATGDELRRALSHGVDRGDNPAVAGNRAMLRRAMRRRSVPIPEHLCSR